MRGSTATTWIHIVCWCLDQSQFTASKRKAPNSFSSSSVSSFGIGSCFSTGAVTVADGPSTVHSLEDTQGSGQRETGNIMESSSTGRDKASPVIFTAGMVILEAGMEHPRCHKLCQRPREQSHHPEQKHKSRAHQQHNPRPRVMANTEGQIGCLRTDGKNPCCYGGYCVVASGQPGSKGQRSRGARVWQILLWGIVIYSR